METFCRFRREASAFSWPFLGLFLDSLAAIAAAISATTFAASDTKPVLLAVDAGHVLTVAGHPEIRPVARLDVVLWHANGGQVGTLARLRDVLPGRYTFGITGRGPDGQRLPPGDYVLRVVAYPVQPGPPSRKRLPFTLR